MFMICNYKDHFEDVENLLRDYQNISSDQISENSSALSAILSQANFSDIENYDRFIRDIINFITNGAKVDILNQSDIFPQLTQVYLSELNKSLETNQTIGNNFDSFLEFLDSISTCDDYTCQKFCEHNDIPSFLSCLIENSKEIHITSICIQLMFKLTFKKPETSRLFNGKGLLTLFYKNFLNKALGKCDIQLSPDEDFHPDSSITQNETITPWHRYCLQKVVIPFCEVNLVLFENNPDQYDHSDFYQIIFSITSILNKSRSSDQDDLYEEQLILTLPTLHHSLISPRIPNELKNEFITVPIVSSILENINRGGKITKHIFECFLAIAQNMSTSFVILSNPNFFNYQIPVEENRPNLKLIELYCKVWADSMTVLLRFDSKIPGKKQICRDTIIGQGPLLLQKVKEITELCSNFQLEHLTTFILLAYANFNDTSCIEHLFTHIPDLIERLDRFFDSKELNVVYISVTGFLNIVKFAKNRSNEMQNQAAQALLEIQEDVTEALDDIHDSIKPDDQILLTLFDTLMTNFQGLNES